MENFNLLEKILFLLDVEVERPPIYGLFHILALLGFLALSLLLIFLFRKSNERKDRILFFVIWVIIAILEVYKQLDFATDIEIGKQTVWDYAWYAFPYQFCSTPLYLLPFVAFLKNSKVRNGIMLFLGTYAFFAGIAVMAYPESIYTSSLLINIQTTVHHCSQIFIGMFIAVKYTFLFRLKKMISSFVVFICMTSVAFLLDIVIPNFIGDETFNMFFISPKFESTLPVLSSFWGKVPYPVFLLLYIAGFTTCAFVVFGAVVLFVRVLPNLLHKRKTQTTS